MHIVFNDVYGVNWLCQFTCFDTVETLQT